MKIIKESFELLTQETEIDILKKIEYAGRICYKSEDKITDESAIKFCQTLFDRKHFAMFEHASLSVKFVVDRGVSHELVRHRIAAYAQESTRYCNYSKDKFGNEISVIDVSQHFKNPESFNVWFDACKSCETAYFKLIELGETPQIARAVLPTCLKTEIVCTYNIREFIHFMNLRALGATGAPHPQMLEVTVPLLDYFCEIYPNIFGKLKDLIQ